MTVFGSRAANLAVWVVLGAGLVAWQVVCLLRRPRLPTFGDVISVLNSRSVTRWLLAAGWVWLGWHLFVRGAW